MGLKSLACFGFDTFGMGVMAAVLHWRGTTPSASDWLNSWASGAANIGAPILRNHAGIPSNPFSRTIQCSL